MSDTCVVIVNWNCWQDTVMCLRSLASGSVRPGLTVVVDNGSSGADALRIQAAADSLFSAPRRLVYGQEASAGADADFILLILPENTGFGPGNNQGLRLALAGWRHSMFLLLNPDIVLAADCLENLESFAAKRPDAGVIGATVVRAASPGQLECAAGCRYLPLATMVLPAHAGLPLASVSEAAEPRLDYILGACMLLRRQVLTQTGLFDQDFVLYYEDASLCLRAQRAGWGLAWCRRAVVRHTGGSSLARAFPDQLARKRLANYHENLGALRFTRKAWPWALPAALVFRFLGKLAVLAWRGELALCGALWAAYRDFFTGVEPTAPGPGPYPE